MSARHTGKPALLLALGILLCPPPVLADDELPAVDFSGRPTLPPSRAPAANTPDVPDLGLLIEGEVETPRVTDKRTLGLLFLGDGSGDRILYEDDHHRVVGNPSRPFVQMMYRYDPTSTDWKFDGNVVRGHVRRGSKFGWSVAVNKPYMAIMDWSAGPNVAAIVIYEKAPNSVRGWKKRYEVIADNARQAQCMGGVEAEKWLAKWQENRGQDCGVRTVDGSTATSASIKEAGP